MTVCWGISSRPLLLQEGENSSDGLIVKRVKKPHSIHHLHTAHPWVPNSKHCVLLWCKTIILLCLLLSVVWADTAHHCFCLFLAMTWRICLYLLPCFKRVEPAAMAVADIVCEFTTLFFSLWSNSPHLHSKCSWHDMDSFPCKTHRALSDLLDLLRDSPEH